MKSLFINPFTDFGFKKIFGEEASMLLPPELAGYENSLKTYRDLKNVIDTAREEGKLEGIAEGEKQTTFKEAKAMKQNSIPTNIIALTTGLTETEIKQL